MDAERTIGLHLRSTRNFNRHFSFDSILFIIAEDVLAKIGTVFIVISIQNILLVIFDKKMMKMVIFGEFRKSVVESTQTYASDFTRTDICDRCKEQIFEFYRKTDIYSLGLVFWSILKAGLNLTLDPDALSDRFSVMGSFSGFHTEQVSGIASYFEHPLDVTTSQNFVAEMTQTMSQMTVDGDQKLIDGLNGIDTSSVLYNEVSKDSRRKAFQQLKDPKILKIYEITIVSSQYEILFIY